MKYKKEILEILNDFNDWGYQYRVSDYAGSTVKEEQYAKEGKEEIEKLANQLQALIDRVVREREKEIFNFWEDSIRMAWMDEDGNVASTKVLNTWLKSTKEHCQLNDSEK